MPARAPPATTISHQYSRIKSMLLTNSIVRCSDGEARPDRRATARKESPARRPPTPSTISGRPAAAVGPLGAAHARDLAHEPHQLARLEIVGRSRQDEPPRQRTVVQVRRDLGHFVMSRGLVVPSVRPGPRIGRAAPSGPCHRRSAARSRRPCRRRARRCAGGLRRNASIPAIPPASRPAAKTGQK